MKPQELARITIENYIKTGKILEYPDKIEGVEVERAGTFVSIKTVDGDLRGCIGTIEPTRDSVIEEIIYNAISSATRDPRFREVEELELDNLKYSVDILYPPEKIKDFSELDPMVYGVIISNNYGRQALLLPNLEGLDTIEKQVSACMRKAGINPDEKIFIQRFKVDRFSEE